MLPGCRLNPRNACQQQGCQSPRQCWGSQVETFRQRGRQPSPASLLSRWLVRAYLTGMRRNTMESPEPCLAPRPRTQANWIFACVPEKVPVS